MQKPIQIIEKRRLTSTKCHSNFHNPFKGERPTPRISTWEPICESVSKWLDRRRSSAGETTLGAHCLHSWSPCVAYESSLLSVRFSLCNFAVRLRRSSPRAVCLCLCGPLARGRTLCADQYIYAVQALYPAERHTHFDTVCKQHI